MSLELPWAKTKASTLIEQMLIRVESLGTFTAEFIKPHLVILIQQDLLPLKEERGRITHRVLARTLLEPMAEPPHEVWCCGHSELAHRSTSRRPRRCVKPVLQRVAVDTCCVLVGRLVCTEDQLAVRAAVSEAVNAQELSG